MVELSLLPLDYKTHGIATAVAMLVQPYVIGIFLFSTVGFLEL